MKKIAFIGAGSLGFTDKLVRDLLTFDAFSDCELRLMDIDGERLEKITALVTKIVDAFGSHAKVVPTLDREKALDGADGVVCTVFNGGIEVWRHDIEIPKRYGVDINVGDTRSVSGIFRAARNIPLMLDICHDIERLCPNAVFLNYTNPMSMLCKAMQTYSKVDVTGLCHSVQGTSQMLADWIGADMSEITYTCAGINHMAFFTEYKRNGVDAYPEIRAAVAKPEIYKKELVRNEMFKALGYYVTESSGHNSEYCAWFRKRPDLIEKYCKDGTNWNPGEYAFSLNLRLGRLKTWKDDFDKKIAEPVDTKRGFEYASNIFDARIGSGTPYHFNGNVLNLGAIENLPYDACVEVPVEASRGGYAVRRVGKLPSHLAVLIGNTAGLENLVVEATMEEDRDKFIHALYLDPLCAAVCSLAEIRDMAEELLEINKSYIKM